ncbi:MAG TPA: hypothetical protein VF587_17450 [Solirubrobacteraceae bacterium]
MWHGRLLLAATIAALSPLPAAAAAEGSVARLPDLVQEAPSRVRVTAKGGRYHLVFRAAVRNAGAGPLLVEGSRTSARQPAMVVRQVVGHDDGAITITESVGALRYSRAASQWRVARFDATTLSRDGRAVRAARSTSLCLDRCGAARPDLLGLRLRMAAGAKAEASRSMDVTGLPAGRYDLVHRVNAGAALAESDHANNAACLGVELSWPAGPSRRPSVDATSDCSVPAARASVRSAQDGGKDDVPDAKGTEPNPPAPAPDQQGTPDQTSTSPGGNAPGSGSETTAPGAPASPEGSGTTDAGVVLACDPAAALRRAVRSLKRATRGRRLLTRRARPFDVRVKPCVAGTFVLSIVEKRTGTVLWRGERDLRTTLRATLRMRMTRAGRRFVARGRPGQVVRMRLRATLTPATVR